MGQIANQMLLQEAHKLKQKIDNSKNGRLILVIVLAIISSVFTGLLFLVDRQPIGPEGSVVGLATINASFAEAVGVNLGWDSISDIMMVVAILTAASFVAIGAIQLIKRKSIKKVDKIIWIIAAVYVCVACIYVVFDKILIINYRPVLLPDETELESSFPSSHILVICTIMATAVTAWKRLFTDKPMLVNLLRLLSIIVMALAFASRLLSGVHWFTDIAGAALYSCLLIAAFDLAIDKLIDNKQ